MRFYVKTYGCQMNVYDSDRLIDILQSNGHEFVDDIDKGVDLIIVNTCAVREKPEKRPISFLFKVKNKAKYFGFGGCVAQKLKKELFKKIPFLNFIFGSYSLEDIPNILERIEAGEGPFDLTGFNGSFASCKPPYPIHSNGIKAFVKIMEGCNNFCSYCIVPYVRGREVYRDSKEILKEVRELIDMGVKEITLIGQNVNSYRDPENGKIRFTDLLYMINNIPGDFWIRYTTSHPKDFDEDLIAAHRDLEKLCNHVHLPFQSGSNRILKIMNRRYTREDYLEKIHKLKEMVKDVAITADVIVGFPGENEKDFMDTIDLIKEVEFDLLYAFIYSKREGTRAANLEDNVPYDEKKKRLEYLLDIQRDISLKKNQSEVGKVEYVLVEGSSKKNSKELAGRNRKNKVVNFEGDAKLIGSFVKVKITDGYRNSLKGVIK